MKAEKITYAMGALTAEGALIYDETISGKRPAVLVAPNWMGMTAAALERGKLVAGDRYVVFVADMYGQGTRPADFGEAAKLANPLRENAVEQRKRIRAAHDAMIAEVGKRNLIDGRRAAVGFCFGGGNVLELARDGADIVAFSRNEGLFAGGSIDGSVVVKRDDWNSEFYGPGATPHGIVIDQKFSSPKADRFRESLQSTQ